jgi:N-formylglutamate deformylase
MQTFVLERGSAPLLVSLPHDASAIPPEIAAHMQDAARAAPDTDWHVARLYAIARAFDASILRPLASRYVVDLNRPVDGGLLYPGQRETGVVPTVTFADGPIYRPGMQPDAAAIAARVTRWWRPYHEALAAELARLRQMHRRVVLWDGHSIRARVPMLFDGRLPDFNLGTAGGASCGADLESALAAVLAGQQDYSHAVNGRFKGGWITRHYGAPDAGIDAVQLELAQCAYMDEESLIWDEVGAGRVQRVIGTLLRVAVGVVSAAGGRG